MNNLQPVYAGDESPRLEKVNDFIQDGFTNYHLSTGMHVGTHIDGPMHITDSKQFIDEISLDQCIGTGCLLNATGEKVIPNKAEYKSRIIQDSIVLLYTGFGGMFGHDEYYHNYPVISKELAKVFIERHVKMVCIDAPSPDQHPFEIHKLLLENNVLIAENLTNLDKLLSVKQFEIIALPLRIHSDSSPARIIARIHE